MVEKAIFLALAVALFFLFPLMAIADWPKPAKAATRPLVQTDYCVIDFLAGGKDDFGQWHKQWVKGYGPCKLLDRYENI